VILTSAVFPTTQWTRVSVLQDTAGLAAIYRNGVAQTVTTFGGTLAGDSKGATLIKPKALSRPHVTIGMSNNITNPGLFRYFKGKMKNLRLWNRAVTVAQMKTGRRKPAFATMMMSTVLASKNSDSGVTVGLKAQRQHEDDDDNDEEEEEEEDSEQEAEAEPEQEAEAEPEPEPESAPRARCESCRDARAASPAATRTPRSTAAAAAAGSRSGSGRRWRPAARAAARASTATAAAAAMRRDATSPACCKPLSESENR